MPKNKKAGGDTTEARTVDNPEETTVTAPDPETIRSEERQRAAEIMSLCRRHDLDGLAADLIGRGVSLDTARAEILDKIADADPLQGRVHEPAPATRWSATAIRPVACPASSWPVKRWAGGSAY